MVKENELVKCYLNGHLLGQATASGSINTTASQLSIGNHPTVNTDKSAPCRVYEFRYYPDSMDANQVRAITAELQGTYSNPLPAEGTDVLAGYQNPECFVDLRNNRNCMIAFAQGVINELTLFTSPLADPHNWSNMGVIVTSAQSLGGCSVIYRNNQYQLYTDVRTGPC